MSKTTKYSLPDQLQTSVDRIPAHIQSTGTWWTGVQRVAIANESRAAWNCAKCKSAMDAISPNAVEGDHDAQSELPKEAIDAIHRITKDSGRLTRSWHENLLTAEFTAGHYVEIVSIIGHLLLIDTLYRGLGLDEIHLSSTDTTAPNRDIPPEAKLQMAWVPTVSPRDATGQLAAEWFPDGEKAFIPHVTQSMSMVVAESLSFKRISAPFYLDTAQVGDITQSAPGLLRPQVELIAARVSAMNECFY
jgi:hypothetical protein